MNYDFDTPLDRRNSDSHKWNAFPEDILPLWISDLDFASPPPVIAALQERVEQGVFGYPLHPPHELCNLLIQQMAERFNWELTPEDILLLPSTHDGFKMVFRMLGQPGNEVLMHTPLYPPLLHAPASANRVCRSVELTQEASGKYSIDFDLFEGAFNDLSSVYLLCNPHNPIGRVYTSDELEMLADICLGNDVVICSDDVHYDLFYPGSQYTPIASLDPEIAHNTITLIGPNKAYNLAGLKMSMAIIQNPHLRQLIRSQLDNYPASIMGIVAATAAFRDGKAWHDQLMAYLTVNRDLLVDFVDAQLPGITVQKPEATYLAWLDCRQANLPHNPFKFFLSHAKVALENGENFGEGGEGFVRLNFGCPRSQLREALDRMRKAL